MELVNEPMEETRARTTSDLDRLSKDEETDESPTPGWKAIRSKLDISIQKKKMIEPETNSVAEITRATIPIQCDLARTFAVFR
jgi:hypothetical protein